MSFLDVPAARLYCELHGSGPLLVMIPGANGVAEGFRMVTEHLAAHYTVLIYDRRGFPEPVGWAAGLRPSVAGVV